MPDFELEKYHMEQFVAALGEKLDLPPRKSETPDFLIQIDEVEVGVELTRFFLPPKPEHRSQQELDGLAEMAVDFARKTFRKNGGPPLYVTVHLGDGPQTKRQAFDLGGRLAFVMLERVHGIESRQQLRGLPGVRSINFRRSGDANDELWYPCRSGWVASAHPADVQAAIDRKDSKVDKCREKSAAVWLVIVYDIFRNGSPCVLSRTAAEAQYKNRFNRLFWLEAHVPAIRELGSLSPNLSLQRTRASAGR